MTEKNIETIYVKDSIRLFKYYKSLGEKALAQVTVSDLLNEPSTESNSIAIIIKHLHGNMLSRWTDFKTCDGEKTWRHRDAEFENSTNSQVDIMKLWKEGWECLFQAIENLEPSELTHIIYIRNEGHSILEAIQRQLAHYSYHVGQIVYLSKMYSGEDWKSLSIPKNQSASFNKTKFQKEKSNKHFTEK